jgi:GntR family transcriptional regulator
MLRAEERLKAVLAQNEQAELLGVEVGTPLLQVDRVSFTYEEQPVEVRRGYYVTASHHYFNHLG